MFIPSKVLDLWVGTITPLHIGTLTWTNEYKSLKISKPQIVIETFVYSGMVKGLNPGLILNPKPYHRRD